MSNNQLGDRILQELQNRGGIWGPNSKGYYTAFCPFHNDRRERRPNLNVNPERGNFRCHKCKEYGNLRKLAEQLGIITVSQKNNKQKNSQKKNKQKKQQLPRLSAQEAMDKLRNERYLADETIRYFQIQANEQRQGWEYPVVAGVSKYKAFFSEAKPKYWYEPGGVSDQLYNLEGAKEKLNIASIVAELCDDEFKPSRSALWLVNGEPAVWACHQADVPAICNLSGERNFPDNAEQQIKELNPPLVVIVPDLDDTGWPGAKERWWKLKDIVPTEIRLLPRRLGEGADVADLFAECRGDANKFQEALDSLEIVDTSNWRKPTKAIKRGEDGEVIGVKAPILAKEIMEDFHFKTLTDTEEVLVYENGVYRFEGEITIKKEVELRLGDATKSHIKNEVIDYIRGATYTKRSEFDRDINIINVKNGLLNIRTREFTEHTPDYPSIVQLPVKYDPEADCPRIKQFLSEIVPQEQVPLLEEIVGYCLYRDYPIQTAFMLVGEGRNGKSTYLNVIQALLGQHNCAHRSIQSLEQNQWATADLFGRLANIYSNLGSKPGLKSAEVFEMLTGGDELTGEKKFKSPFTFRNYAKLIYSSNQPPEIHDDATYAFWRRWKLVDFPYKFEDKEDKDLLSKLTTPDELSGLLNVALDALDRVFASGLEFTYEKTVSQTAEHYIELSNPVKAFAETQIEYDSTSWISNQDLYDAFIRFVTEKRLPGKSQNAFHREFGKVTNAFRTKQMIGGVQVKGWKGIRLSETNADSTDRTDRTDRTDFPFSKLNRGNNERNNTDNNKLKNKKKPYYPYYPYNNKGSLLDELPPEEEL